MQTPWDCSRNDTKEVPLNSVQKCLDLICCKKTSFFSWTWSLSQILKAGPWKCLNLIPCENIKCVRKYPFFLNVGIISNFKGVPLKMFESHLLNENIKCARKYPFSLNWALSQILEECPWKCLNLISRWKYQMCKKISSFTALQLHRGAVEEIEAIQLSSFLQHKLHQTHNYKTNIRFRQSCTAHLQH